MTVPEPTVPEPAPRRRGRRPATEDTRGAIVAAARAEFASSGYDGTTMRGVARAAGVDPRLVHHYFEGKEDLFVATLELPVHPQQIVEQVVAGPREHVGERLVRFFFGVWDTPRGREVILALVRSAVTHEDAARMLGQFIASAVVGRIAAAVDAPEPALRASLVASQMIGVVMIRYVVRLEPLASATVDDLVPHLAPTVQRYLTAPAPL